MSDDTLQQQIRVELAKLYDDAGAMGFLAARQKLLNGRIPARMIAIGDGAEVLRVLRAINDGVYL